MPRFAPAAVVISGILAATGQAVAADPATQTGSAHDFSFELANGLSLPMKEYEGKVVLVVNTATACGFSGQLSGLQELHERYADQGLVVLGVPSNDFGGQEPRKDGEIAAYCEAKYGATFQMTAKTSVRGDTAHPFYQWAVEELGSLARPNWNFHKYLVGPDGSLVSWFGTPAKPTSKAVVAEIEKHLDQLPADQSS
ncbi:glutathione peroxidase [Roseibium sp.]|uniref:glutathione peroxidase n=1 Tax=Roseibium sp. TaxID=1936156 RepID=UPI003B506E3E